MAKMGKLTPEEETRNKMLMRERDRERKRVKRMNPEYRKLEQERDRDRKKARRSNEAFRQLEKLRDKLRKERKKGIIINNSLPAEFVAMPSVSVEPEVIISDIISPTTAQSGGAGNNGNIHNASRNSSNNVNNNNGATITTVTSTNTSSSTTSTHVPQINKGLLYPPHNFHHPLPIAGVTLMPQLCHPILHQNLSATLYSANGIKQEFNSTEAAQPSSNTAGQMSSGGNGNNNTTGEEQEVSALIEPEIILQTSTDIISAPHHFHNHAHTHHLHQQQCSMFQHMSPQAHMSHMRVSHALAQPPPPLPHSQANAAVQQQLQQHYASNKGS